MFNGMLKSDDVEFYEICSAGTRLSLSDNCKGTILIQGSSYITQLELPNSTFIGKEITICLISGTNGNGKPVSSCTLNITHSFNVLFTLKQGSVTLKYIGQELNGITATNQVLQGWIILGGVQGDTAITGYAGSVVQGSGAYAGAASATTIGQNSNATASPSSSFGYGATNSGADSTVTGTNSSNTGTYSFIGGNNSANTFTRSSLIGADVVTTSTKISLKANPKFSTNSDAQAGKFILMRQTTDATPLVMSATNAAASTSNILILPNNGTYAFKGIVVAKDATTGDSAMWEVTALMKRGANASTTAIVGTPTITKVLADAGASAWSIALTADTTNGGGAITVTGEVGKTIRFVCNIDSAEVI